MLCRNYTSLYDAAPIPIVHKHRPVIPAMERRALACRPTRAWAELRRTLKREPRFVLTAAGRLVVEVLKAASTAAVAGARALWRCYAEPQNDDADYSGHWWHPYAQADPNACARPSQSA